MSTRFRRVSLMMAAAAAVCAVSLLVVPAWAQALWADYIPVPKSPSPQWLTVAAFGGGSTDETLNVSTSSSGPAVSAPSSVVIPGGQGYVLFDIQVGPTVAGDQVTVIMTGPSSDGSCVYDFTD